MILFEHDDFQVIRTSGLFVRAGNAEGTAILLTDTEGRLILAREYRRAIDQTVWGLPGGMHNPGETPESCARRELLEEFGAAVVGLSYLGAVYPQPGVLDRKVHLFHGELCGMGDSQLEADEIIEAVPITLSDLQDRLAAGDAVDGEVLCALQLATWRGFIGDRSR